MIDNVPAPGTILCALEELHDGAGRVFTWGEGKSAYGIVLLRHCGAVTAYLNLCPHFRIPLDHQTKVTVFREYVLCSHHYAAFRASDGYCVEGPCEGASLDAIPVVIDDGVIRLAGPEAR